MKQVYWRRYESRSSPNPGTALKTKNKIWRKAIFNMADGSGILTPCNVACGSGIVTVNSRDGSTLQCETWLWDDMPLNSPDVRHIGILHLVSISTHHRSRHVILYQSAKLYLHRTTLGRKKWRHVDFQDGVSQPSSIVWNPIIGSLKSPVKLT